MSRPDEGLIHAWLDGEVAPEESARIAALVARDPEWRAAVAEARGLIAASSRIVSALDAVPGGVTRGARSQPHARRTRLVRPWMAVAAGAVLVVGTAYTVREQTRGAFGPTTDRTNAPASRTDSMPAVASALDTARFSDTRPTQGPPARMAAPPLAERDAAASGAGAPAGAQTGAQTGAPTLGDLAKSAATEVAPAVGEVAAPQPSIPAAAPPPTLARERERMSRDVRREASRNDAAPAAALGKVEASEVLAGCWLVSAPDSLRGRLRDPAIRAAVGDTLLIEISAARLLRVVRAGDRLTGELTASREVCPPPG